MWRTVGTYAVEGLQSGPWAPLRSRAGNQPTNVRLRRFCMVLPNCALCGVAIKGKPKDLAKSYEGMGLPPAEAIRRLASDGYVNSLSRRVKGRGREDLPCRPDSGFLHDESASSGKSCYREVLDVWHVLGEEKVRARPPRPFRSRVLHRLTEHVPSPRAGGGAESCRYAAADPTADQRADDVSRCADPRQAAARRNGTASLGRSGGTTALYGSALGWCREQHGDSTRGHSGAGPDGTAEQRSAAPAGGGGRGNCKWDDAALTGSDGRRCQ